jgi:uncharacterized membrane protein
MPGGFYEIIEQLFNRRRGKVVGAILGLLVGVLLIVFGFWKGIFIILCIGVGYLWGRRFDGDSRDSLSDWWERFFGKR